MDSTLIWKNNLERTNGLTVMCIVLKLSKERLNLGSAKEWRKISVMLKVVKQCDGNDLQFD